MNIKNIAWVFIVSGLLFGCSGGDVSQTNQQKEITKKLFDLKEQRDSLHFTGPGETREQEEAVNKLQAAQDGLRANLTGLEVKNWVCLVTDAREVGKYSTSIKCVGDSKMPSNSLAAKEVYDISVTPEIIDKGLKVYVGDRLKFSGKIDSFNIGINNIAINFTAPEVVLIK